MSNTFNAQSGARQLLCLASEHKDFLQKFKSLPEFAEILPVANGAVSGQEMSVDDIRIARLCACLMGKSLEVLYANGTRRIYPYRYVYGEPALQLFFDGEEYHLVIKVRKRVLQAWFQID